MENNQNFEYEYSAKRQEEIEQIKKKYMPKTEDKLDQLKKLDQSATMKATKVAIFVGLMGCLIMGIGMSFSLVWTETHLIQGIITGISGMLLIGLALPTYHKVLEAERKKIAPQILALAEELSK